jgi:hypothetical protein
VDQFQLVLGGYGRIGRHDVARGSLHYAAAYQSYGPILAGDEGLRYLTVRARYDSGAHMMPGARGRRPSPPRTKQFFANAGAADLRYAQDGSSVVAEDLRPGSSLKLPAPGPGRSAGTAGIVMSGALTHGREEYGEGCCLWNSPGGQVPTLLAGPQGASVVLMTFPPPASGSA